MSLDNYMKIEFDSLSINEPFARNVISAFVLPLNPTISELTDIKTALSEAVTNAVIHAYGEKRGLIIIEALISENTIHIKIIDFGKGISDVKKATEPFYSTRDDENSGMGFTIMRSFMDNLAVTSEVDKGTTVEMSKKIAVRE